MIAARSGLAGLLRSYRALPAAEREAIVRACVLVVTVRVALWLLPSRLIVRAVRRLGDTGTTRVPSRAETTRAIDAVETVSRRIPGASCLTQAVSAQMLLRHYGQPSRLCIGVGRDGAGDFCAHAWLEQDERILIGAPGASHLTRLPDLATAARTPAARGGA